MGLVVPGHGTFPELVVPSRQHIVDQTLEAAEAEWRRGVHDRRGTSEFARILEYIHSGLGWRWVKYERNGKFAWCGGFAAFSLASAGLHRLLRYHAFSSVERLAAFGRYRFYTKWRGSHARLPGGLEVSLEELHAANGGLRLCQSVRVGRELAWEPQPGDVVLMGPESEKHPDGKHIALVREVDLARGELHTVEGNATGTGPDGSRYEGVIHHVRPLATRANRKSYHVRTLVRVALADCVPGIEIVAR